MTYRVTNVVLLSYILFFFSLPFFSAALSHFFPALPVCPYRMITHSPCPFCGITSDLTALFAGGTQGLKNPLTQPIAIALVFEFVYRAICVKMAFSKSLSKHLPTWIRADIYAHAALFAALIGYLIYAFS